MYRRKIVGDIVKAEKNRFLLATESMLSILDDEYNVIFQDKISNFVLIWNDISEEDKSLHVSILIDYRTLDLHDHIQVVAFSNKMSDEDFAIVLKFRNEVCPKMEQRLKKSFWKAIRYEMPEKPRSKRTTYKKWLFRDR